MLRDTSCEPQTPIGKAGVCEEKSNALPNFQIVHEMRGATKQQTEELAERSSSHFSTVEGRNPIETLEGQDDRQEIN